MSVWVGSTVLLTGATGSFGRAFLRFALDHLGVSVVRCFSRDEFKQQELVGQLKASDLPRVRTLIGDVRDYPRVLRAMRDVTVCVHAAALKRVDRIAYDPLESIHTNVGGSENVMNAAIEERVERVVALSSDKAVTPANLYGATKLMMEHTFSYGRNYVSRRTPRLVCVRYGNVLGSRGSVLPLWLEQAAGGGPLTLTDERMTRFWISLQQACQVVAWAGEHAQQGDVVIPQLPRARMVDMAVAISPDPGAPLPYAVVGERAGGEKLHETLLSEHETRIAHALTARAFTAGMAGYVLRHGDLPNPSGHEEAVAPLSSDTAPLLDVAGCRSLLVAAGLRGGEGVRSPGG